jgi:hypothetical protein
MVLLSGPKTVIARNWKKKKKKKKIKKNYVCRSLAIVHSILLDLRRFFLRKELDLKKIGKILKSLCYDKGKISGNFVFKRMDVGMFDRFCTSLKTRAQLEERRFDMNISDQINERYIISMNRNIFWTNKWM